MCEFNQGPSYYPQTRALGDRVVLVEAFTRGGLVLSDFAIQNVCFFVGEPCLKDRLLAKPR